jgi:hypothetical protein
MEGSVFLCRRYVCCTVVSARLYPRCHGVQVNMDSVHPLSLSNIYTRYTEVSCHAGLCSRLCLNFCNYSETAVSQLNRRRPDTVKFKPFILPMPGFSLSNNSYNCIYMVQDYFCLSCIIYLCNHTRKEFWMPRAIRGLVCPCQVFQQRWVLCSPGAALSRGERPPRTPRWDRRKS